MSSVSSTCKINTKKLLLSIFLAKYPFGNFNSRARVLQTAVKMASKVSTYSLESNPLLTRPGMAMRIECETLHRAPDRRHQAENMATDLIASATSPQGVWVTMNAELERPAEAPRGAVVAHSHPFYGNLPSVNGRARLTPGNLMVSPQRKPSAADTADTDSSDAGCAGDSTEKTGPPTDHASAWMAGCSADSGRKVKIRHPDREGANLSGLLHPALYLGSTQLTSEARPSKATRMAQAQEAVNRIRAPEGEKQPRVPVDLFVSVEKLLVLNTATQEVIMDHALRTVTHIADMDCLLVLMARRRRPPATGQGGGGGGGGGAAKQCRVVCHLFQTERAQQVAQSIGLAFTAAYNEFLRANGKGSIRSGAASMADACDIEDAEAEAAAASSPADAELLQFCSPAAQNEVTLTKTRGEPLGVALVDSGWGALLPSVLIANMRPDGPAARCGELSIGDLLLSVNGTSLVGLPMVACRRLLRACRSSVSVRLRVVSRPPVIEAVVFRSDASRPLGFSVRDGVVCSLLRGGVAERGGVRVGHRIVEIDGRSMAAASHDRIVAALAAAVGEIRLRTMPETVYRLLTGLETPRYV